ncbi:MAG: hypothetical protein NVS9B15_07360 [Acidobacteriaceae bacterium]
MGETYEALEDLRAAARALLEKAHRSDSTADLAAAVDKATGVLRLSADVERAKQEMESASKHERSERLKEYVTLLAPLISVITLAATLGFQGWQFSRTEKDKADAAMDDKWQGTLKSLSEKSGRPPSVVVLRPFLDSPKYAAEARDAAVRLLAGSKDTAFFDDLFGATFVPAKWSNLDDVLRLDRALRAKTDPLLAKSWDPVALKSDESRLSPDEQQQFHYGLMGVSKVSAQISPLVRTQRPQDQQLDLSATYIMDADWQGADLRSANLENAQLVRMNLSGANLGDISRFNGAGFASTAWWRAARIGPDLLQYLRTYFKCDPAQRYGYKFESFTAKQCEEAMAGAGKPSR